ncbi:hypothetical protein Efla_005232 [Eimeria flavescens]
MVLPADWPHSMLGICLLLLLLCLQRANAGTHEATQTSWTEKSFSSQGEGSQAELNDASLLSDSPLATVIQSPDRALLEEQENGRNATAKALERSGVRPRSRPSGTLRTTGLGLSIAALAFFGLVVFRGWWRYPFTGVHHPETPGKPGADLPHGGEKKALERLAAVTSMASAAEHLADALDTKEGEMLLTTMYSALRKAQKLSKDEEARMNELLDISLGAVTRLHEVARAAAAALAQGGPPSIAEAAALLTDAPQFLYPDQLKIVSPFVTHLRDLTEHYERLSTRLEERQAHVEKGGVFRNENDKNLLLTTAADLLCIRKTSQDRKNAADAALKTRDGARTVVRTLLLRQTAHLLRQLTGDIEMTDAYLQILTDAAAGRSEKGMDSKRSMDFNNYTPIIKSRLEEHKARLSTLTNAAAEAASGSLLDVAEASRGIEEALVELNQSLAQTLELMMQHPEPPTEIDSSAKERMRLVLQMASQRVKADNVDLRELVESTEQAASEMLAGLPEGPAVGAEEDYLAKNVLGELRALANRTAARVRHVLHLAQALDMSKRFPVCVKLMDAAVRNATATAAAQTESQVLKSEALLVASIQRESRILMNEALTATKHIAGCPDSIKKQLAEMQKQLQSTCEAATEPSQHRWEPAEQSTTCEVVDWQGSRVLTDLVAACCPAAAPLWECS